MADLEYEKRDNGIAVIRINRPDALGAFTLDMIEQWVGFLADAQSDPAVRAVIATGTGKGFCTGTDTKGLAERAEQSAWDRKVRLSDHIQKLPRFLEDFDKPYIAAINGHAYGAGFDLALMADIRFAARSAKMAMSYVKIGIMAGDGGAWFLPRIVGTQKALDLLWSGRALSAEEAEALGIVLETVDDDKLMAHAIAYAERLAAGPPLAIRMMKRAVYQGLRQDLRGHLDMVASHTAILQTTRDSREAVKAFNEKRAPRFCGQ